MWHFRAVQTYSDPLYIFPVQVETHPIARISVPDGMAPYIAAYNSRDT